MSPTESTIRQMLEEGGVRPTPDQLEAATRLHQTLAEQLARVPASALRNVEPHDIQPIRRPRRRRRA